MKDYLLLFRGGPQYIPTADGSQVPISPEWKQWMERMVQNGQYIGGQRLIGNTGTVLKDHRRQITDGPFAEGKEIVAGYLIIKARDMEEAMSLTEGCPLFAHADGSVEVREIAY